MPLGLSYSSSPPRAESSERGEFLPAEGGHFVQVEVEDVAGGELGEVNGTVEATGLGALFEIVGAAGAHFGHGGQLRGEVFAEGLFGDFRRRR